MIRAALGRRSLRFRMTGEGVRAASFHRGAPVLTRSSVQASTSRGGRVRLRAAASGRGVGCGAKFARVTDARAESPAAEVGGKRVPAGWR